MIMIMHSGWKGSLSRSDQMGRIAMKRGNIVFESIKAFIWLNTFP